MPNEIVAPVIQVGKTYKTGDTEITALQASSMDLKAGELTLIIGPSGSAKTTFIITFGLCDLSIFW